MNADLKDAVVFDPRSSVFIGGQIVLDAFAQ
jgi:hypothetical protein